MTTIVQQHPLYKNYGSTKDGNVFNHKGHKMAVGTQNNIQLYVDKQQISILHKLFVWQCFNGELPIGLEVIFDNEVNGDFCDKLIAVNAGEKEAFTIMKREKIRQQMVTAGYFPHPLCPNYVANKDGYVYSLYTNKELIAKPFGDGYIHLTMFRDFDSKIVRFKHTIVWESNTNTLVPTGFQIDHIDQNKANNAFANLQCISREDHMIKTHKENPHIIKLWTEGSKRKVIRKCIHSDDTVVEFASRVNAAESVLGSAQAVGYAIRKIIPYMGFMWFDTEDPDLPGEEWLQGEITKYRVSNLGRIWPSNAYKTFWFKGPTRYMTQLSGRNYGVHELICYAFHGSKPSLQHTVDHIDGNPHNNHYENLRYATKKEQAINRRSVKPVEGYIRNTGEIVGIWPTLVQAAAATGANRRVIACVLKGRCRYSGKTPYGEPIAWRYA